MATTFNWVINTLERETADGFVYKARYDIFAADEVYSVHAYGAVELERPEELVPYDQLTHELVTGWVKARIGEEKIAEIETALQQQLDEKRQPTRAAGVPWQ